MGAVWRLIAAHQATQPYGASIRAIARAAGVRESTFDGWKELRRLPKPDHLRKVARQIGVPYPTLLRAALLDAGYLASGERDMDIGVVEEATPIAIPTPPSEPGSRQPKPRRPGGTKT